MKKIVLVLAVLMLAAPAFGDAVTITAAQVGSTEEVTITYSAPGKLPRAFALDITVDNGQTIDDVTSFARGECDVPDKAKGYGIFPASFAREIDADDPNWADANYTPVADVNDLVGDTQGGKGTGGVTIEMGSLYEGPNKPASAGTLCSVWVSGDCNVSLAANVGRAGVVFEDGNAPAPLNLIGCHVMLEEICTVPAVVGDTNAVAQAAIIAAGFTVGNVTTTYTDCSQPAGDVTSQSPGPGVATCGSAVDIVVRGVCDGDLTCDGWVNASDETDLSNYIVAYGGMFKSVPRTHANWDEKYNFTGDDFVNASDETALSNYIVAEGGMFKSVACPGPGMP